MFTMVRCQAAQQVFCVPEGSLSVVPTPHCRLCTLSAHLSSCKNTCKCTLVVFAGLKDFIGKLCWLHAGCLINYKSQPGRESYKPVILLSQSVFCNMVIKQPK